MSDYIADAETINEMVRLLDQDLLMTRVVSGLLPPDLEPGTIHDVLDIGCGPGGWVLEMAKTYPSLQVTGVDISARIIDYAQKRAMLDALPNAHFFVADFRALPYADASFDVVNARLVQWFLGSETRAQVVREWYRVLRPGGVIRFTESEMSPITNSAVFEQHTVLFTTALERMGKTIAPGGFHSGTILLLRPLLEQLGCMQIQEVPHLLNFSAGIANRAMFVHDIIKGMQTMGDVMVKMKLISKRKLTELQEQTQVEINAPGFWGMLFFVSAWGYKAASQSNGSLKTEKVDDGRA